MMQILEETSKFFGIVIVETHAVVGEAPFEVFVVVGWEVKSEGGGAEEAVQFRGVDER